MDSAPPIVLLSDFGAVDPFVGVLKGVLARLAPGVPVIDLTHEIPPGDVKRAALTLWQACDFFPAGSVFLCVVDPGVGTTRKGILARSGDYTFVGPDNGLFTFVLKAGDPAWELANPALAGALPSSTFHGRDLFAPAAAYAAQGAPGGQFGPLLAKVVALPLPRLDSGEGGELAGEVLHADRFGNLLTSLGAFRKEGEGLFSFAPWLAGRAAAAERPLPEGRVGLSLAEARLRLPGGRELAWANTFAEAPPGECAFLVGSSGLLEIIANGCRAADLLDLQPGDAVILRLQGEQHGRIHHPGRSSSAG